MDKLLNSTCQKMCQQRCVRQQALFLAKVCVAGTEIEQSVIRSSVQVTYAERLKDSDTQSFWTQNHITTLICAGRGCSSVSRVSDCHAADTGFIARCSKGFFSLSQLSVQTLSCVSIHPHVQSHALTSVCTLKIV